MRGQRGKSLGFVRREVSCELMKIFEDGLKNGWGEKKETEKDNN